MDAYKKSIKKRLLSGGSWVLAGKATIILGSLAVSMLLTRLLPENEVGAFFLTLSVVSFVSIIALFGAKQALVKLIAESLGMGKAGRAGSSVKIAFGFICAGLLMVEIIWLAGGGRLTALHVFNSPLMAGAICISGIWIGLVTLQTFLSDSFRGFYSINLSVIFGGLCATALSLSAFFVLFIHGAKLNLNHAIMVSLASAGLSVLIGLVFLRRKTLTLEKNGGIHIMDVFRLAWPLYITDLILFCFLRVDLWIVGAFRPDSEVAIYGAVMRLTALVGMPLVIANLVLAPLIAEMFSKGKIIEFEKTIRTIAMFVALPSLMALAIFAIFGSRLLSVVYGDFYATGHHILILLGLGKGFNVLTGPCGITLMMTGHQKIMMKITAFSTILMVVMSLLAVDKYGPEGVAFCAAVTMVLHNLLMLYFVKKRVGIRTHAWIAKPTLQILKEV